MGDGGLPVKAYALKNFAVPTSSSGGAFPAIAQCLHRQAGDGLVVCGAVFDGRFEVRHALRKFADGLEPFSGSKYVQSHVADAFKAIPPLLAKGVLVLFSGMPCQVAALKRLLEGKQVPADSLLTVDLVCHGTPRRDLWKAFLGLLRNRYGEDIRELHFRHKAGDPKRTGKPFIRLDNRRGIDRPPELETWMRWFYANRSLCRGCFSCPFRGDPAARPSDLTIGDFWGVAEFLPSFREVGDVSLVLSHTPRGDGVMDAIARSGGILLEECGRFLARDDFRAFNRHLFESTPEPPRYAAFWRDFETMPFGEFFQKHARLSRKAKIIQIPLQIATACGLRWKLLVWRFKLKRLVKGIFRKCRNTRNTQ